MDVFPKYIVEHIADEGLCLILSKCTYHHQLANKKENVRGGGWFSYSDKVFTLYGSSHDFGTAKEEDVRHCIENGKVYTSVLRINEISKFQKFIFNTGSELIKLN